MNKTLYLAALILLVPALLCAEDIRKRPVDHNKQADSFGNDAKVFNLGDGGIARVFPRGRNLQVELNYNRIAEAPLRALKHLGLVPKGRLEDKPTDRFVVRILDGSGYEMCKQFLYYGNFKLLNDEDRQRISVIFQTPSCGKYAYEKIAAVLVDYK